MKLFDKDTKEEAKGKDAQFAAKPLSPMAAEKLDNYRKHGLGSGKILNLSAWYVSCLLLFLHIIIQNRINL